MRPAMRRPVTAASAANERTPAPARPARGRARKAGAALAVAALTASLGTVVAGDAGRAAADAEAGSAVPRAECGPGSSPETGLQGQVPLADRTSGRSKLGYRCNLELLSRYQGQGQGTVGASYGRCQYLGTILPSVLTAKHKGVNVVDMSDPRRPRLSDSLVSPATVGGTWETLKVHQGRGLLAAVSVGAVTGGFFVSVYDVKTDCAHPRLLNGVHGTALTMPGAFPGHEASWSPDGRTYWTTGLLGGAIAALDMTDPRSPEVVYNGLTGMINHGVNVSADGNRIYVASSSIPAGVTIFDSSDVQRRDPHPQLRRVSETTWSDGIVTQFAQPFTDRGRPYLLAVDELGSGGARIFDISDDRRPRLVRRLKLEINRPENLRVRGADTAKNGIFGYDSHYCTLDRPADPTALACGWVQSGIRVFDIRDLTRPREIAYFNPPAQVGRRGRLVNSAHAFVPFGAYFSDIVSDYPGKPAPYTGETDMTADWCMSPPRFDGDRLWVSCDDNGALLLRFTNRAYPLR
ncbi:LVIVD repeat-containing protein [Actinomadura sp. GTD37]|uniref:LVIVD repeat-containing protein n=1 Tax=Actinomadura sp. GTD37 TaxID=1778030 RepID=UPI0035BF8281